MKQDRSKLFRVGLTAFAVVACSIVFSVVFSNLDGFFAVINDFIAIISSVIYGFIFAYLMNPVMKPVESLVTRALLRRDRSERTAKKAGHAIGVIVAVLVFLALVYAFFALILPQIIVSIKALTTDEKLASFRNTIDGWIRSILEGSKAEGWYAKNSEKIFDKITLWLKNAVTNTKFLKYIGTQAYTVTKGVINMLLGIVVAVYMLISKEKLIAQVKKTVVALFKPKRADRIMEIGRKTNEIFFGFIIGTLIDSLIVGVLCYVGMVIFRMPYAVLISVLIAVTNVIPFFGPLIGLIPSALLILIEDPLQAFYFTIFILAMQQVDGNYIAPRILGKTMGISDFWILISITVFGGLFGFAGLLLGVPAFGVLYMLAAEAVNRSLRKKNQPLDTDLYLDIQSVEDLAAQEPPPMPEPAFDTEIDADDDLEIEDYDEAPAQAEDEDETE